MPRPWRLNWQLDGWRLIWRGTKIGQVRIPERLECEHFLVCGATGSGKSTALRHIVKQILRRGEPAIIIDPHGEFTAEFYDQKQDWLLNPADERCPYWSLDFEIQNPTDIEAVARALLRRDENNWDTYARDLIAALLTVDATALPALISLPPKELHKKLPETAKGLFDPEAIAQRSAVIGNATTAIKPLRSLPPKQARCWSAVEWASNPCGRIFLTSDERNRAATQAMQGVWLDLLIRELLNNRKGPLTWLIITELPAMGYQPRIGQLLTEGRKYRVSAVIEFQNIAQLRGIYGHDNAITIVSSPATHLLLNPGNAPETTDWINRVIGNYELNPEVRQLKTGQAYLVIKGYQPTRIKLKKCNAVERIPAFIPRKALNPPLVTLATFTDKAAIGREKKRLAAIVQRCTHPSCTAYKNYGGRGIGLREAWYKHAGASDMFVNYLLVTIGLPPADNYSLDRIDNDLDYEPGNLRWNTREGQAANKRKAREHAPTVPA